MAASKTPSPIDSLLVRELAGILNETDLTEIEVEKDGLKIRVAKSMAAAAPMMVHAPPPAAAPAPQPAAQAAPATAPAAAKRDGEEVKSPMVGTAYLSPQPGAPAFIKPGDKVKAGQTLLIVEAMKTMNPIASPRDGVVAEVLVGDAQPVEYGEPLVVLQ
ncbi:acetyl-CoA carboxylase biotin carboxyl carrier protein [Brevundimonas sp. 2R-24]|uniref:Biotin carboxyl carrier protein of acetyl-CoA carboxylase n=1 Tax=Peiella sedimenti TaxID=3061083 RepID=A0ABT8SIU6_9CAUL|nr:acetyl-CoA carboxylase biotin carboxyl carrier protein [Caulobacteraceae bacterium XZ-24]